MTEQESLDNLYPEHGKLLQLEKLPRAENRVLQEFFAWLGVHDYVITDDHDENILDNLNGEEDVMYRFFGIDKAVIEAEKTAMLEVIRNS